MAAILQPLNSQNYQTGAENVSKSVMNSAARSGIQIINNGKIELSAPGVSASRQTATKESPLGSTALTTILKAFQDIKNSIEASNEKIVRFVDDSRLQKGIEKNFEEANANNGYGLINLKNDMYAMFSQFSRNSSSSSDHLVEKLSELTDKSNSGLGSVVKTILQGITVVVGGYLLSKTPLGEVAKNYIKEKFNEGKKLITDSIEEFEPGADSSSKNTSSTPSTDFPSTSSQPDISQPDSSPISKTRTPVRPLQRPKRNNSGEIGGLKFAHPDQKGIVDKIAAIVLELQRQLGKKFLITSGRRSVEYNKKLKNSSTNSAHLRGTAVDLQWANGSHLSRQDFLKIIPLASSLGVLGIGVYPNAGFIHLDVDHLGRRFWGENGVVASWALDLLSKHRKNMFANGEYELEENSKTNDVNEPEEGKTPTNNKKDSPSSLSPATKELNEEDLSKEEKTIPEGKIEEEEEEEETTEERVKKASPATKEKKKKSSGSNSKFTSKQVEMANLIRQKFKDAGFSDAQAEAAVVNSMLESKLDPNSHNTYREDSVGLFQLNRKGGLGVNPKTKKPYPVEFLKNPVNNIDIAIREAKHSKEFRQAKTTKDAIEHFARDVERPSDVDKKVKMRQAAYAASAYPTSSSEPSEEAETATKIAKNEPNQTNSSSGESSSDTENQTNEQPKQEESEKTLFQMLVDNNSLSRENMLKFLAKTGGSIINTIQKTAGLDESKMVRYQIPQKGDMRLVPYNSPDTYDPSTISNVEQPNLSKSSLDGFSAKFEEIKRELGEMLNKGFNNIKSTEKSMDLNKSKGETPQQPIVINQSQGGSTNRSVTSGAGSIVPDVRDHESTLEKVQYNNFRKTGTV